MNLTNVLAISGLPGLYELVSNRSNGLQVIPIGGGKSKFCSSRSHQFTPLETVAIYTMADTVELKSIFRTIGEKAVELPIPSPKSSSAELNAYFAEILPDYDRDRVYPNDIKKVIKWYNSLNENGYLDGDEEE